MKFGGKDKVCICLSIFKLNDKAYGTVKNSRLYVTNVTQRELELRQISGNDAAACGVGAAGYDDGRGDTTTAVVVVCLSLFIRDKTASNK
jgi:hypothetical protein